VRGLVPWSLFAYSLMTVMVGHSAQAQALNTSTRVSFWTSDRSSSTEQDIAQLELALRYSLNVTDNLDFVSSGSWFALSDQPLDADIELQQAYLHWDMGPTDFRFGRQVISWGRSDGVNPTDVFAARDYTRLLADDEGNRLGIAALQFTFTQKKQSLSFVYAPEFRPTILPNGEARSLGIDSRRLIPAPEAQFGLRLNTISANLDWSVSASYANDRTGTILPVRTAGDRPTYMFPKVVTIGADFEAEKNGFGLRGEVAYSRFDQSEFEHHIPLRQRVSIVLGIERTFEPQLRLTGQVIAHLVDREGCVRGCSHTMAGSFSQFNLVRQLAWQPVVTGFMFNAHQSVLLDKAFWEVRGVAYVKGGGTVQLRTGYQLSDEVAVILGADRSYGKTGTFFGALRNNDSTFLMLRRGF
jgi:hypothetical protein